MAGNRCVHRIGKLIIRLCTYSLLPLSHKSGNFWAFYRIDIDTLAIVLSWGSFERQSADEADGKKQTIQNYSFYLNIMKSRHSLWPVFGPVSPQC